MATKKPPVRKKRRRPSRGPTRRTCRICRETSYVNPWLVADGIDASVCSDCRDLPGLER